MKHANEIIPINAADWREWLAKNHQTENGIWLVFFKKGSPQFNLSWSEAVDEALCFGWIDSVKLPMDEFSYKQFYSERKATSTWSKINKDKVEELAKTDKIMPNGWKAIELAKSNGTWSILDAVERLEIPEDLKLAFDDVESSEVHFSAWSKSVRKGLLQWLVMAKRPETRQKRITEIASCAGKNIRPKGF